MGKAAIGLHQSIAMTAGHFDEIAKHAIMFDFQGRNARFVTIACLHRGNSAAGIARNTAQFIQPGIIAIGNIAAIRAFRGRG